MARIIIFSPKRIFAERRIAAGEFLEHANVHGKFYGTCAIRS